MSIKVAIDVSTVTPGSGKLYDVDIDSRIGDVTKMVIRTHPELKNYELDNVDFQQTKLMYNGKTLDPAKTLGDYTYFEFKPRTPGYKMHIIVRNLNNATEDGSPLGSPVISSGPLSHSDPSTVKLRSYSLPRPSSPISIIYDRSRSDKQESRSFPGSSSNSNSFLESQINRLEQRPRSLPIKQLTDAFADVSAQIKDLTSISQLPDTEKFDKIAQLLATIDSKLTTIIESGQLTPIGSGSLTPNGPFGATSHFTPPNLNLLNSYSP